MRLELFICADDPRKLVKDYGEPIIQIMDAKIYRECSAMYPEFLIPYSENAFKCNMAYLATPNRSSWYFIKDRILLPGGRMVLICAKDVLFSWSHYIQECTGNVVRQETIGNRAPYMYDSKYVQKANTHVSNINFGENTFINPTNSQYCYVLTVLGGEHITPSESGNQLQGGGNSETN